MYEVKRLDLEVLLDIDAQGYGTTVYTTYPWLKFLEKNQHAEPVVLELNTEQRTAAVFVGGIVRKGGIKILGSPFEGWLTPDMGFICLEELNYNEALRAVARYAFRTLHCLFVQISDHSITIDMLDKDIRFFTTKALYLDNSLDIDTVLSNFTKNGRRDIRASERKGTHVVRVPFDYEFAKRYYNQLVDVFAKQGLKPFYTIEKLNDMVDAFRDYPDQALALECRLEDETCIATVFSLGYRQWGYYVGAASFREYQKLLPNESLFWAFVRHWNEQGISHLDLVGYREYKMKYAPEVVDVPAIVFERFPGLLFLKDKAKSAVMLLRKIKGGFSQTDKG